MPSSQRHNLLDSAGVEIARTKHPRMSQQASRFVERHLAEADLAEIGAALNVRYCLSGAVRKAGSRYTSVAATAN